jgi:calcineurin-like phosphoesterase family protein
MRDIWVTSDTHFNHSNILRFDNGRGDDFDTVSEMNETMVQNWNNVVKPGDIVYHLGDVFFGSKDEFKSMWPRLHGRKRLIPGNHDDIKFLSSGSFFQKVMMWRMFPEYNTVLTHVPIHMGNDESRKYQTNIHGHLHRNLVTIPNKKGMMTKHPDMRYHSVCVEHTNYTPVHLYSLMDELK